MKKRGSYCWFVYFIKERSVDVYEAGEKKGSPKARIQAAVSFCLLCTKQKSKICIFIIAEGKQ